MSHSFHRYKIKIEYDGSSFCGWQRQSCPFKGELRTVQNSIESALFKITGQSILVEGAGRTDRGVHATGQIGHFDLNYFFDPFRLKEALNSYLRHQSIVILSLEKEVNNFHARFSAIQRSYVYRIINRRAPLALEKNRAWHVITPLNEQSMAEAAQDLVGRHDFSSFRAAQCQSKNPLKTLTYFKITKEEEQIIATIQSKSFLHHQVRIMMGTLKLIGEGKWNRQDLKRILNSKERKQAGPTAPAHGLYLTRIDY